MIVIWTMQTILVSVQSGIIAAIAAEVLVLGLKSASAVHILILSTSGRR
jgi:hypothetical protein